MEDLGEVHTSLVDALTSHSKTEALSSLTRYMQVIAKLHGLGSKHVKNYTTKLQSLTPTPLPWLESAEETCSKTLKILEKFKIPLTACFENEITSVFSIVKDPGPFTTLIHGDICPDNVFDDSTHNDMRIIDFEWGFVGNALLDAVYLRMCMPTCWCAKVFPEEIIDIFDPLYRKELMKHLPDASCDALYYESYAAACAYWMLGRISNLENILEKDNDLSDPKYANLHPNWKPKDNQQRPRTRYRLQAFVLVSEKYDLFPSLRAMAQAVLKELEHLWKDTEPLAVYRAFE